MDLRRDFQFDDTILINFINLTSEQKEIARNWRNSEGIRRWMFSDHIISVEEHFQFLEKIKDDNKNFYWLAQNENGEYMGVISLNRLDLHNKNAYLGIYTNPENIVPGSGRILIECLKKLAFDITHLHTLRLEVIANNERAVNFYKNFGFREEGRLKEFVFKDGKWCDVIVMGILYEKRTNS